MPYTVQLSDLSKMTPQERRDELARLVEHAHSPEGRSTRVLDARIRSFEEKYGLSSKDMVAELKAGDLQETADISLWLFYLDTRDSHVAG